MKCAAGVGVHIDMTVCVSRQKQVVVAAVCRPVDLDRGSHCLTHRSVRPLRRIGHSEKVRKHVSHFCDKDLACGER